MRKSWRAPARCMGAVSGNFGERPAQGCAAGAFLRELAPGLAQGCGHELHADGERNHCSSVSIYTRAVTAEVETVRLWANALASQFPQADGSLIGSRNASKIHAKKAMSTKRSVASVNATSTRVPRARGRGIRRARRLGTIAFN